MLVHPSTSVGIPINIQSGTQQLKSAIDHAFTTKFVEDYGQVPRTVEADEQTWATQELGVIQLEKGL
ncbi:MAG: hypothetical protein ACI9CQ_004458 [Saprospiraceae bacterium]|jgi:hypothetical protein